MFNNLSEKITKTINSITNKAKLNEDNIKDTLREIRISLLDADVALPVVKDFIEQVKERAIGAEVIKSLTPGQTFVKVLNEELKVFLGDNSVPLNLSNKPTVILMAGLQGAGKTTSAAKLAKYLLNQKKTVMLVSTDIYRDAAIEQLRDLSKTVGATFFESNNSQKPIEIAKNALESAKKSFKDVLIIDTAGRLAIDEIMMQEISELNKVLNPNETLFVIDAMVGQDAVNTAKQFNDTLNLTGVVVTKIDGDTRGGVVLSVKHTINKPIKFLGVGEKADALEVFHPDRISSRILGMGDVLGLIEQAKMLDVEKNKKLTAKLKSGKSFNLEDFQEQISQLNNIGGLGSLMQKIPSIGGINLSQIPNSQELAEKQFKSMNAIINSMTKKEKRNPDIINGSRRRRIAKGSGVEVQDVNRMLKQHQQMQTMMKKVSKGGLGKLMQGMGGFKGFRK